MTWSLLVQRTKRAAMIKLFLILASASVALGSAAFAQPMQCSNNFTGYQNCYGPNGQSYQSQQDKYGNGTTYGPNGQSYQSQQDKYGNTTTYGPGGEVYQYTRDKYGNTTTYG